MQILFLLLMLYYKEKGVTAPCSFFTHLIFPLSLLTLLSSFPFPYLFYPHGKHLTMKAKKAKRSKKEEDGYEKHKSKKFLKRKSSKNFQEKKQHKKN